MKLKGLSRTSGSRWWIAQTIADESSPPDSAAPTGTSLRRCRRTLVRNRSRHSATASANEILRRSVVAAQKRRGSDNSPVAKRSEEHTSELQSLMRISYAVFCLKKKKK